MPAEDVLELYDLFENNKIKVWINGGCGVDALLGEQTRSHKDVDIVIQKKHVTKLRKLLESKEYKEIKLDIARPHNFVYGDTKGHEIDIHVIKLDDKGNGIYGPAKNNEMFPASSLTGTGTINKHKVRCLTAEFEVESHKGYKFSEKDFKDVSALCERFGIDYPKGFI